MHIGQMDITSAKCVINSISRFIHLVSCQTLKPMPLQKNCNTMVGVLRCLKPVLDNVVDCEIPLDDNLYKECEELDVHVNKAREFVEKWSPKMSRIHSVLQSGELLIKLQNTSLRICHTIDISPKLTSSASVLDNLQHHIQELQCLEKEPTTVYIEEVLRNQKEDTKLSYEHLREIIELLKLTSNQELLKESIAVEKERLNAEVNKTKGELDEFNQIVNLVCNLRDHVMKTKCPEVKSGVSVPTYFRCPLSLELMLDPVIVASGQTYERQSIQTWLDNGLNVCPKTHQRLTHTNLIPNYTVKAMITNWCEEKNVELPNNSKQSNSTQSSPPTDHLLHQDFDRVCSFGSSHSSNSNSKSSLQTGNAFEKQKGDNSSRVSSESNRCENGETEKFEQQSLAPSCSHSRKFGDFPTVPQEQFQSPGSKNSTVENEHKYNNNNNIVITSHSKDDARPASNSESDKLITTSHVSKLIEDLQSQSNETQAAAAEELRLLTKFNMENRIIVGQCGAIMHLLPLLYSEMKITQEHAVTAILNLSINEDNKTLIMEAGAIEPLIYVLKTGNNGAKENSAAALFSLSVPENNKAKIGRSGAIKALVELLASGTLRGKKDAATALFNLSIFHDNKARMVQAGAVKFLAMLLDPADGMVDKAVALLANLSTIPEGQVEIVREGGIPLLVELVESGSHRGKENAASILLQLSLHSRRFCTLVLQEGAVPPIVALSQFGTPRAKEKAQQLLSHFRSQRTEAPGRGKS
ncbi:U-box domain-containing protein 3-like isoform X2 [Trifolium pratense]|uniref:U-box domain-containing protein 3-like isoform X2 n=1 Tax=Trifolium pratense TaxID=57577 RepID=UPI001E6956BC|nr:U-box domain-containing protein 3-like isoform X2 [Trifolium pratense]